MAKSHLKLVTPTEVKRTVAPGRRPTRRPNADIRSREHLTPSEVMALIEAAKGNRYGHRDATMILVAFRHGLGPPRSAICAGTRSTSTARCSTSGASRTAPQAPIPSTGMSCGRCEGSGARARRHPSSSSASGDPRSRRPASPGWTAGLELKAHPHMLRHACGYALANKGHDTRAIQGCLGTDRSPARLSTRPWRRTGSRTSGGTDRASFQGGCSEPTSHRL
jgi:integrase